MPLPAPRTWQDGEETANIPSAADLNLDWRDSFNFLLGNTKPMAHLRSTVGQSLAVNTPITVQFNDNYLLRGGMAHSTSVNNTQLTVPYTGQYQGYIWGGFDTLSTVATKLNVRILKNGTMFATAGMKPELTGGWNIHCSFTADLAANDILTMTMVSTASTAVAGSALTRAPRMVVWYAGDYA